MDGLANARAQLGDPNGLPLSMRLLCDTHRILMRGGLFMYPILIVFAVG